MADAAAAMPGISHRRILAIALPVALANATIPLLGAVDTAVVGRLGGAVPIGAVGLGAIILTSVYWVFGFLRMGTSGLIAQARGAGDAAAVGAHLLRALAIAAAAGAAMIALQRPLAAAAFALAPGSAAVETLARDYLAIRIWGAPATIALYALTGWLIAAERARAVLALQLLQNGLNGGLSALFALGLGWGVPGVAAASLIAEMAGLAAALWLARGVLAAAWGRPGLADRAALARLARVNGDIMIRSVLLQGAFTAHLFLSAGQGDLTLAAVQVLMQFLAVTAYALDGFAFAAEALVGGAVGGRRPDEVRRAAIATATWGAGGAALLAAVFALAGPALIDALAAAPAVREAARAMLPWVIAAPLIGIASWMLDGVFIGATLTAEMRRAMTVAVAVYAAAATLLPPLWGAHGLWAALMILNAVRAVTMARLYRRAEAVAAAGPA